MEETVMFSADQIKAKRKEFGLSQIEFSRKYKIPVGSIRNWEQDRCSPDEVGTSLLHLIFSEPQFIASILETRSPRLL